MSRFVNLEISEGSERQLGSGEKEQVKDEAYYLGLARTAYETANFEQGLRFYAKALEYNPKNARAWTGQVRMLVELGEFREAKLWADKALERFPNVPELLAAKAVALARSGDLQNAIAFSDASMEERGDTAYVWLARGDVLLACQEPRADFCFGKALLLAPHDWFTAWLAGRIWHYYKQIVRALEMFRRAVELNPANAMLWLRQGQCQMAIGMVGAAEISFTQARHLNPLCLEAEFALDRIAETGPLQKLRAKFLGLFKR